jgi:hypothetical protein
MSKKFPKSDLPENIVRPHRAALRAHAQAASGKTKSPRRIDLPSQGLKQSDILTFNNDAERAFVRLISEILREDGPLSYREAIREAAYELNVSTETAKRYLEKHSARRAEFCIEDGYVSLRQVKL